MPKIVKTRTNVYEINAVALGFSVFNETWKRIRGSHNYKGFECYNCNKSFNDGEEISIIFTNRGNKVVCRECAIKFQSEL